jgi:hypothetical protein
VVAAALAAAALGATGKLAVFTGFFEWKPEEKRTV